MRIQHVEHARLFRVPFLAERERIGVHVAEIGLVEGGREIHWHGVLNLDRFLELALERHEAL